MRSQVNKNFELNVYHSQLRNDISIILNGHCVIRSFRSRVDYSSSLEQFMGAIQLMAVDKLR